MKIKVLCRNPKNYVRESRTDVARMPKNLDPEMHPLETPREYVRALNATKLDRVFAKPFVASLSGHTDGVCCMGKHPRNLSVLLSGSCDGEIKAWSLARQECLATVAAHSGFVRGLCTNAEGTGLISIGDDKIIKQWAFPDDCTLGVEPLSSVISDDVLLGIDHHRGEPVFATCGSKLDVWDERRSEPITSLTWGVDSITHVKFNPIETNVLSSCGTDRAVVLYDIRQATPIKKMILKLRSNAVCWNPMEAFHFTAANEDWNLYTFDMRHLRKPLHTHTDHTNAVLDVDYSPTGTEFVTGSYDKTIRIFNAGVRRSREVYYTKRMQQIHCVKWSSDSTYILSGSDETNIRIWKANASQKLGKLTPREERALNYTSKLKEKFRHHPHISRIARHRHVPRLVRVATKERKMMADSRKRKDENIRLHTKPGTATSNKGDKVLGVVE